MASEPAPRVAATAPANGEAVAILVPVKAFDRAKVRLAPNLSPAERAGLARRMASQVLTAARPLPTWVVCDDRVVAEWAEQSGAGVLWRPGHGLNPAVAAGVSDLAAAGHGRVMVVHADLPLAGSLGWLVEVARRDDDASAVVIVPDRHDDGTNVLSVPTRSEFRFQYGPGSFRRHLTEAERLGLAPRIVRDRALGWDVDVPDDLRSLIAVAPEWAPSAGQR